MTKCDNPNCDRNHEVERAIATVCAEAAKRIAQIMDGGPADAIYELAAALVQEAFINALPGKEKGAIEDMKSIVEHLSELALKSESLMADKRKKDASRAMGETPANSKPI